MFLRLVPLAIASLMISVSLSAGKKPAACESAIVLLPWTKREAAGPNYAKIPRAFRTPETYTATAQRLIQSLLTDCDVASICTYLPEENISLVWQALDLRLFAKVLSGEFQDDLVRNADLIFAMREQVDAKTLPSETEENFRGQWIKGFQYKFERLAATLQALSVLETVLNSEGLPSEIRRLKPIYEKEKRKVFANLSLSLRKELLKTLGARDPRFEGNLNSAFMMEQVNRATRRATLALDATHLYGVALDLRILIRVSIEIERLKDEPDTEKLAMLRSKMIQAEEILIALTRARRQAAKELNHNAQDLKTTEAFFAGHFVLHAGLQEAGAIRENKTRIHDLKAILQSLDEVTEVDEVTRQKFINEEASALMRLLKLKAELDIVRSYVARLKAAISDYSGSKDLPELQAVLDLAPIPLTTRYLQSIEVFALAAKKPRLLLLLTQTAEKFDGL